MNINEYIQDNFKEIERKITAVTRNHQNTDDLISDCILNLLEKGPDYTHQLMIDNKVQHYLVKMAYIQFNSSTSPFHTKYRKQKWSELDDNIELMDEVEFKEDTKELVKDIKIYIGNLPFYQRELANKHFLEGNSQREMSKMYNINRVHISKDLNTIKKNIHLSFSRSEYKTK